MCLHIVVCIQDRTMEVPLAQAYAVLLSTLSVQRAAMQHGRKALIRAVAASRTTREAWIGAHASACLMLDCCRGDITA